MYTKSRQLTGEIRAEKQVKGVQNASYLLPQTLTTVAYKSVVNGTVQTPPLSPPIAETPTPAPSSTAQRLQQRRQPLATPKPLRKQPSNELLVQCWILQNMNGWRIQGFDFMGYALETWSKRRTFNDGNMENKEH